MDKEAKESRAVGEVALERAIVLQLLRDDRERKWSHAQLRTELEAEDSKIDQEAIEEALTRLHARGGAGPLRAGSVGLWCGAGTGRAGLISV